MRSIKEGERRKKTCKVEEEEKQYVREEASKADNQAS